MVVLIVRSGNPDVQRIARTVRLRVQPVQLALPVAARAAAEERQDPLAATARRHRLLLLKTRVRSAVVDDVFGGFVAAAAGADPLQQQQQDRHGGVDREQGLPVRFELELAVGFLLDDQRVRHDERDDEGFAALEGEEREK